MNKHSKDISDGIYDGFDRIVRDILKSVLFILGIILGGILIILFLQSLTTDKQKTISAPMPLNCNYPILACSITESKMTTRYCDDEYGGCMSYYQGLKYKENICGYQEANAWLEQVKIQKNDTTLRMECT